MALCPKELQFNPGESYVLFKELPVNAIYMFIWPWNIFFLIKMKVLHNHILNYILLLWEGSKYDP